MKDEQDPVMSRLTKADARRFASRLERLVEDLRAANAEDGEAYELATALSLTRDE